MSMKGTKKMAPRKKHTCPPKQYDASQTKPSEWVDLVTKELKSFIVVLYAFGLFAVWITMRKVFLVLYIVGGLLFTFLYSFFHELDEINMEERKEANKKHH